MPSLSWLHLTDLHVGMENSDSLLPNFKQLLFDDLRRLHERTGGWDFVIFSGDVAQAGKSEEFDRATDILGELFELFKTLSSNPYLLVTPGNHDLVRPGAKDPTLRAMLHWHIDPKVKSEF